MRRTAIVAVTSATAGSPVPASFTAIRSNMSDVSRYVLSSANNRFVFNGNTRFIATTSATGMFVNWFDSEGANASTWQLSVFSTQGGSRSLVSVVSPVPSASPGSYTTFVALPGGAKTIEVVNGPTAMTAIGAQGNFAATQMTSVAFQDAATVVVDNTSATPRMLIQGTSIECGFDGDPTSEFGLGALMRNGLSGVDKYPGPVVVDAMGSGQVHDDWSQASGTNSIATMLSQMTGLGNVTDWILPLATNDWAHSSWSSAALGTAVIAGWPTVKAAFPNAKLWLVGCPHRLNEGNANAAGSTLQNYRDQGPVIVAGLPAGQAGYFNCEPSIPFNSTYYNADFVHLTNLGQATYAQLIMQGIGR